MRYFRNVFWQYRRDVLTFWKYEAGLTHSWNSPSPWDGGDLFFPFLPRWKKAMEKFISPPRPSRLRGGLPIIPPRHEIPPPLPKTCPPRFFTQKLLVFQKNPDSPHPLELIPPRGVGWRGGITKNSPREGSKKRGGNKSFPPPSWKKSHEIALIFLPRSLFYGGLLSVPPVTEGGNAFYALLCFTKATGVYNI